MAAHKWKDCVEEAMQEIDNSTLLRGKLSTGIQNGELSLHQFVECLGPHLTGTDATARLRGVKILVDVCVNLKSDFLNQDEVTLLSSFLRDCLKGDDTVVTHALQGMKKLCQCDKLPKEELLSIMNTIFNDVFTQSRVPNDRKCVFQIFQYSIDHRLRDLKSMGSEFVSGFIQAVEGERDPHNLIVVFGLVPKIVRHFDIDPFAEELFEVTACYFPIDYSRSPKEPRQTSKEDLILSLRACLASTPKFAEHCVPLLLEKLDSTLISAKIDTFETLTACIPIYGFENMKPFNLQLWQNVRRDVFSGIPLEGEIAALEMLTAVIKNASSNVSQRNDFAELMVKIIEECVTCINKPELKMALPAAKLLRATSVASRAAFESVTEIILPLLIANFATKIEVSHRAPVVEIINSFVKSCREISAGNGVDDQPLLANFKSPLLLLYNTVINEDGDVMYRISGANGLLSLALATSLLNESELEKVFWMLSDLVVRCNDNLLRKESKAALATLSGTFSENLMSSMVGKILRVFDSDSPSKSSSPDQWDMTNDTHYEGLINVLSAIPEANSVARVIDYIWPETIRNISGKHSRKAQCNLACIKDIAARPVPVNGWAKEMLTSFLFSSGCSEEALVQHVAAVFETMVPRLEIGDSLSLLKLALDMEQFPWAEVPDNRFVFIIESILNCCSRELFQEENGLFENCIPQYLRSALALLSMKNNVDEIVSSVWRSMASLINKIPEGSTLDDIVAKLFKEVEHSQLTSSGSNPKLQRQRMSLLAWVTKALLMRGHNSLHQFVEELFRYLENDAVSSHCCTEFGVITRDVSNALNVQCHANLRFLYKQRLFVLTKDRLIEGFSEASDAVKHNYLVALVQQLLLLPKEVFNYEVPTMLPVLIRGLSSDNVTLLCTTLHILLQTLRDDSSGIEQYAGTLIPHLLRLSTNKNSMKVRVDAVQCLEGLLILPVATIVKHKKDVIQGLAIPIADHKRLVRQAAVSARSNWFLLGSPGGS